MGKIFQKIRPNISETEFLQKASQITKFTSSSGKNYAVLEITGVIMSFKRLDAKSDKPWKMNLKDLYRAYKELNDFRTINFKQYVPITHSPGRGLLIHLGLIG